MPVDVGELIAEEFVVDLPGLIDLSKGLRDEAHFLHQLNPFCGRQMKQFCCVALEDDDGPAGKELILVKISPRQSEVSDKMICSRPATLAGLASWICHG
jgi:hypothetical protein